MNLDTILDIFGRSIEIVTKCIEDRRKDSMVGLYMTNSTKDDNIILIGEPNIEAVLQELLQIKLIPANESVMAYGGALYEELYDRVIANKRRNIQASIIDILRPFREYSYSMFPETLFQETLNILERMTDEQCARNFYDPTPEMMANAKAIRIADEKREADARGEYFKPYITTIITTDILRKTAAYLHWYVIDFAVMLDCVLLDNGCDLLELQNLHNIKLINEHKEILLSKYTGSSNYVKQLLSKINNSNQLILPKEIDTERVRKYFSRAIELGYITYRENNDLKWTNSGRGGLAQLGYFIQRVFCPNNIEQIPEKNIDKLFGVSRIGSAITQLQNAKKTQKWIPEIDTKIFYD